LATISFYKANLLHGVGGITHQTEFITVKANMDVGPRSLVDQRSDDGGNKHLRNTGQYSRRQTFSYSLPWKPGYRKLSNCLQQSGLHASPDIVHYLTFLKKKTNKREAYEITNLSVRLRVLD
jgi:hypothetical protein